MYRPTAFQEDNVDKLVAFMKANSFATLVSIVEDVPFASHIPLVITIQEGVIKLTDHLAKRAFEKLRLRPKIDRHRLP